MASNIYFLCLPINACHFLLFWPCDEHLNRILDKEEYTALSHQYLSYCPTKPYDIVTNKFNNIGLEGQRRISEHEKLPLFRALSKCRQRILNKKTNQVLR